MLSSDDICGFLYKTCLKLGFQVAVRGRSAELRPDGWMQLTEARVATQVHLLSRCALTFPCIRLMFSYPRDLGTKIINDPGFDLAMKEHREAPGVGIENENVKNYGGCYFNLFMLLGV